MKSQKTADRLISHMKKGGLSLWLGMRPSAIKGRFTGPKVLMTSIPKSGTNLLENTLLHFPELRRHKGKTFQRFRTLDDETFRVLSRIKNGEFLVAHLPAFPSVVDFCRANRIKVLFMTRDPHDIMVSHFKYVSEIDTTHELHEYYKSLSSDDLRLMTSITGDHPRHDSIRDVLLKHLGWLADPNTLVIRFEDLIGSQGGGDDGRQRAAVMAIANHLGIEISDVDVDRICSKIYSQKTPTFRSGRIKTWEKYFKENHLRVFNRLTHHLMEPYGYGD